MTKPEFLSLLHKSLEISSVPALEESTSLRDLEEFDSFSILTLIALFDEHFHRKLTADDFAAIKTPADLMLLAGENNVA